MRHLRILLPLLLGIFLFGCAATGQQKPVTPEDNLRYAQAVLTGVYTTVGNAAEAKTLTGPEARKYYVRIEQPEKDLTAADGVLRASGGTLPPDTVGKINLALGVLTVVADELRARLPPAQTAAIPKR